MLASGLLRLLHVALAVSVWMSRIDGSVGSAYDLQARILQFPASWDKFAGPELDG